MTRKLSYGILAGLLFGTGCDCQDKSQYVAGTVIEQSYVPATNVQRDCFGDIVISDERLNLLVRTNSGDYAVSLRRNNPPLSLLKLQIHKDTKVRFLLKGSCGYEFFVNNAGEIHADHLQILDN